MHFASLENVWTTGTDMTAWFKRHSSNPNVRTQKEAFQQAILPRLSLEDSTRHLCNDLHQEDGNTARSAALPDALQLPGAHHHIQQPQQAAQKLTSQDTSHHNVENVNVVVVKDPAGGVLQPNSQTCSSGWKLGPQGSASILPYVTCSEHVT